MISFSHSDETLYAYTAWKVLSPAATNISLPYVPNSRVNHQPKISVHEAVGCSTDSGALAAPTDDSFFF